MSAISSVSPIRFRNIGHVRFKASDFQDSKTSLQKSGGKSQQMNSAIVNGIRQFHKSTDVRLDYTVDIDGKKISLRVINKSSGKVIRKIPIKPELKMAKEEIP